MNSSEAYVAVTVKGPSAFKRPSLAATAFLYLLAAGVRLAGGHASFLLLLQPGLCQGMKLRLPYRFHCGSDYIQPKCLMKSIGGKPV